MYNELFDIGRQVTALVTEQMTEVTAEEVGLDRRAAYRLYVSEDTIAVSKDADRTLQYYGGFEYVDKEYRQEMGDWVFYFADDERIGDHLAQYFEGDDYYDDEDRAAEEA